MVALKQHLIQNNYILDCPHCGKNVYRYIGEKPIPEHGVIHASDFKPISKKVPKPISHQKTLCPFCGEALASVVKGY